MIPTQNIIKNLVASINFNDAASTNDLIFYILIFLTVLVVSVCCYALYIEVFKLKKMTKGNDQNTKGY